MMAFQLPFPSYKSADSDRLLYKCITMSISHTVQALNYFLTFEVSMTQYFDIVYKIESNTA